MKQEAWINAHVHAYQHFGGVTRLLVPDNLKTGVIKNTKDETVYNGSPVKTTLDEIIVNTF